MSDTQATPLHIGLFILHAVGLALGLVVAVLAALVLVMPALMSAMAFASPGSQDVVWTNLLVYGFMSLPVVIVVAAVLACVPFIPSLIGFIKRRQLWTVLGLLATLACFALPLISVLVMGVGWVGLDVYCDGVFNCR